MNPAVVTPFVISGVLWLTGARLGQRLTPRAAAVLLTLLALVTALATGLVLCATGLIALAEVPQVAGAGHWSQTALRSQGFVPAAVGVPAGFIALVLVTAALTRTLRALRDLTTATLLCRTLGPGVDGLVVIDDERPTAYALPGPRGRVIVSTAMLRALRPEERCALLAHERAHLTHRHVLYVQLAEIAAAANPLLRPAATGVRTAVERWADEVAAAHTGDRRVVARTLARAGLARAATPRISLAVGDTEIAARIKSLVAPRPRHATLTGALLIALTLASSAPAAATAAIAHNHFERAQTAYTHGH